MTASSMMTFPSGSYFSSVKDLRSVSICADMMGKPERGVRGIRSEWALLYKKRGSHAGYRKRRSVLEKLIAGIACLKILIARSLHFFNTQPLNPPFELR